jgi:TonB family protein
MMKISRALLLLAPLAAGWSVVGCGGAEEPSEPPQLLTADLRLEFPISLWDEGVEGETRLMVHVTALGEVDSAFVKESSGYAEFDSAAVAGVGNLRFAPGRKGEKRIDRWVVIPVKFTREGAAVAATGEQRS